MALTLVVNPEVIPVTTPQYFPDFNLTVPCKVADTDRTRAEWEKLIKAGVPLLIKDVKAADAAEEDGD